MAKLKSAWYFMNIDDKKDNIFLIKLNNELEL
jgi:hypothetical protein